MLEDKERITVAEASEILGVSERTVWAHIKAGKLKKLKDGSRTMLSLSEVMLAAQDREPISFNPETHIVVERRHYESLLGIQADMVKHASELGFRIGQLEAEKRNLEGAVRLLEDRRPWWKRLFS